MSFFSSLKKTGFWGVSLLPIKVKERSSCSYSFYSKHSESLMLNMFG